MSPNRDKKTAEDFMVFTSVGKGAALMSMFHSYYGPRDIDTKRYEETFPDSGSNWKEIHDRLTPTDIRMQFVLRSMLIPLEDYAKTLDEP